MALLSDRAGGGQFTEAAFTDVALVQIGDENQQKFLDFAQPSCCRHCGVVTSACVAIEWVRPAFFFDSGRQTQ